MTEKEDKNSTEVITDETISLIPLILFEKYIEIIDDGIEYLKSFNNKVK